MSHLEVAGSFRTSSASSDTVVWQFGVSLGSHEKGITFLTTFPAVGVIPPLLKVIISETESPFSFLLVYPLVT